MGSKQRQCNLVRDILRHTITSSCRSGLENPGSFSIEALIGITLETGDVLLISINEAVDNDFPEDSDPTSSSLSLAPDDDPTPTWPSKRNLLMKPRVNKRKRGRPRMMIRDMTENVKESIVTDEAELEKTAENRPVGSAEHLFESDVGKLTTRIENSSEETVFIDEIAMQEVVKELAAPFKDEFLTSDQVADQTDSDPTSVDIPQVGPYSCTKCDAVYKYRKCLIEHKLKAHTIKEPEPIPEIWSCEYCTKTFTSKRSLTRHIVVHARDRVKVPCHICNKLFSCDRHAEFHIKTVHKGMYPFMCDLCGKQVTTKTSLCSHMASKHAMKRIKCDKCQREYSCHATYSKHTCLDRPKSLQETQCPICKKHFDLPKRLVQHMSKHKDPKFVCDLCGRSFRWVSSLHAHKVAAHKGENNPDQDPSPRQQQPGEQPLVINQQPAVHNQEAVSHQDIINPEQSEVQPLGIGHGQSFTKNHLPNELLRESGETSHLHQHSSVQMLMLQPEHEPEQLNSHTKIGANSNTMDTQQNDAQPLICKSSAVISTSAIQQVAPAMFAVTYSGQQEVPLSSQQIVTAWQQLQVPFCASNGNC